MIIIMKNANIRGKRWGKIRGEKRKFFTFLGGNNKIFENLLYTPLKTL